ncbi:MAG: tyrosine-type recombinase/integrase [Firmicutes bacterium]|nr:tyrosine-type recombinase/integrase [Bacillota bacterium]
MKRVSIPKWEREVTQLVETSNSSILASDNFESCLGAFFKHLTQNTSLASNTIRLRYVCLTTFCIWLKDAENISDFKLVDKPMLRRYLLYCKETRKQQGNMLKCSKVAIKHFFTFLAESKIIPKNPAQSLQVPTKVNDKVRSILNSDEILSLFKAPRDELVRIKNSTNGQVNNPRRIFTAVRDIAIISVLLSTGIRTEELCIISPSDLNLAKGSIRIHGKGDNLYIKRYRSVYIDIPEVLQALKNYLKVRVSHQSKHLFCSWDNFPLKSASIIRIVKKYAGLAGITRNVTPLLLRHTFCSHLVANEADPFSTKELMGHKKLLTTLHYYTHLSRDQIKAQMLKFNPLNEEESILC